MNYSTHKQNCNCSFCYSLRGGGAGSNSASAHLPETYSTDYTDKRLEEFDKKFSDHGFDNGAENEFHSALIRRFISESIQQALAEDREMVREESTLYFRVRQIPLSEEFINIINPKDKDI